MSADYDVVIVGGGLFGRVIGRYLQRQGRQVRIYEAGREHTGSAPAACLMKPSWMAKLSKKDLATSMAVLDECYGVHEIDAFVSAPGPIRSLGKRTTIYWVAPRSILKKTDDVIYQEVTQIDHGGGDGRLPWFRVVDGDHHATFTANAIVVATGVWCDQLLKGLSTFVPGLRPQWGAAFTWPCEETRESRVSIQPWAPYKQLVMLPNRNPGELWVGDGTALLNWSEAAERRSRARTAMFAVAPEAEATMLLGQRPYVKGLKEPAYLKQVAPRIWTATGGAKNGTIGAAWAAYKLSMLLPD